MTEYLESKLELKAAKILESCKTREQFSVARSWITLAVFKAGLRSNGNLHMLYRKKQVEFTPATCNLFPPIL